MILLAATLLMVGSAAAAAEPPKDQPKQICKRPDASESRIPKPKVCMTKEQWEELARQQKAQAGDRPNQPARSMPY